jgi:hypothetical protein
MERLVVRNFGPITSADIDVRQFTLLVGHVSSGKSTIAKLLSIFNSMDLYRISSGDYNKFILLLKDYNIDLHFEENTEIEYDNGKYRWKVSANDFRTSFEYAEIMNGPVVNTFSKMGDKVIELSHRYPVLHKILGPELQHEINSREDKSHIPNGMLYWRWYSKISKEFYAGVVPFYIPAERNIFSIMKSNIFTIINDNASFPRSLARFGMIYENSRDQDMIIPFLDVNVKFTDDEQAEDNSSILLPDGTILPLHKASSGYQSIIPLMSVLQLIKEYSKANPVMAVVEEPELNLFPTVQKSLVEYIAQSINERGSRCIITSHSPYILASFDALVQAGNASEKDPKETAKIVPEELWIKYDDISCYYFDEKGNVTNAKNDDFRNIGSEVIDTVSDAINDDYDKLLNIIYS